MPKEGLDGVVAAGEGPLPSGGHFARFLPQTRFDERSFPFFFFLDQKTSSLTPTLPMMGMDYLLWIDEHSSILPFFHRSSLSSICTFPYYITIKPSSSGLPATVSRVLCSYPLLYKRSMCQCPLSGFMLISTTSMDYHSIFHSNLSKQ